jgi:NitT/TauT family transport system substrate-binding protein
MLNQRQKIFDDLARKMHVMHMQFRRRPLLARGGGATRWAFFLFALAAVAQAQPLEKAVLYLGWRAEPELGGFFQALNAGIYRRYGLDAEIKVGNPQTNAEIVLSLHKADFIEGSSGDAVNFLRQDIPTVAVAALFQKSPRVLIAHPGRGRDTLEQMKGKPILVGTPAMVTLWPFLKARYGFTDDQIRPYTFNEAPFLRNPDAIQEGYITEEPFLLGQLGVQQPVVILLSDHGYPEYANLLMTNRDTVAKRPDYVQRFVTASVEGWQSYLFGDPSPGNRFIAANNPDVTAAQIAYSINAMRKQGLCDSGDAQRLGIGAMTDESWASFYRMLVAAGAVPAGLDIRSAYTLRFVNQKAGL